MKFKKLMRIVLVCIFFFSLFALVNGSYYDLVNRPIIYPDLTKENNPIIDLTIVVVICAIFFILWKKIYSGDDNVDLSNFESMDVNILLSIVNMKLRDEFNNLDDLVKYYDISKKELLKKLRDSNFKYSKESNQFK